MGRRLIRSRWLRRLLISLLALAAIAVVSCWAFSEAKPAGAAGPAADELAHRIERAVRADAFRETGAVKWVFAGRHRHLWDRARGFARVRYGQVEVLLRLSDRSGQVFEGGRRLSDSSAHARLDEAHGHFINDSFWLNPFTKLFDPGVSRKLVRREERPALLVEFASGGRTPGDAYLLLLDAEGRPRAWKMWVSILPLGGLQASFEGWTALETGAWVATRHRLGPFSFELTQVSAAESVEALVGSDPFEALLSGRR